MKLCVSFCIFALIPLLYPFPALAQELPEANPITDSRLYLDGVAVAVITLPEAITLPETPVIIKKSYKRPLATNYCSTHPTAFGCCVSALKASGDLPKGTVTKNGTAGSIPVKPLDIKQGETAVIVTNEGPIGHVLEIKKEDGQLVSITEGGMGYKSVGRIVDPKVVKGEVNLTH